MHIQVNSQIEAVETRWIGNHMTESDKSLLSQSKLGYLSHKAATIAAISKCSRSIA